MMKRRLKSTCFSTDDTNLYFPPGMKGALKSVRMHKRPSGMGMKVCIKEANLCKIDPDSWYDFEANNELSWTSKQRVSDVKIMCIKRGEREKERKRRGRTKKKAPKRKKRRK